MSRRQRLIEEISFWQELVNESTSSVDSPEYQRMRYALQFAEYRLALHEQTTAVCASAKLKH